MSAEESDVGGMAPPRDLKELCERLHVLLAGDSADVDEVLDCMASYKSNEDDWRQYALYAPHRYTRNLVDDGNGKFNLMILAWSEGQASTIHDHAGSHCCVKMLAGELSETLYAPPSSEGQPLKVLREATLCRDQVTYINDAIGLHRMENGSHTEPAVSLHMYSPPYNACHCYDAASGSVRPSGTITFYSKRGEKCDYTWSPSPLAPSSASQ